MRWYRLSLSIGVVSAHAPHNQPASVALESNWLAVSCTGRLHFHFIRHISAFPYLFFKFCVQDTCYRTFLGSERVRKMAGWLAASRIAGRQLRLELPSMPFVLLNIEYSQVQLRTPSGIARCERMTKRSSGAQQLNKLLVLEHAKARRSTAKLHLETPEQH